MKCTRFQVGDEENSFVARFNGEEVAIVRSLTAAIELADYAATLSHLETSWRFPNPSEVASAPSYHRPFTVLGDHHPGDDSRTSHRTQDQHGVPPPSQARSFHRGR